MKPHPSPPLLEMLAEAANKLAERANLSIVLAGGPEEIPVEELLQHRPTSTPTLPAA